MVRIGSRSYLTQAYIKKVRMEKIKKSLYGFVYTFFAERLACHSVTG